MQPHIYKNLKKPLFIEYDMLYSNQELLSKYNKTIPKTWDTLIETAKSIIIEEQNNGNEITGYVADMTGIKNDNYNNYLFI